MITELHVRTGVAVNLPEVDKSSKDNVGSSDFSSRVIFLEEGRESGYDFS